MECGGWSSADCPLRMGSGEPRWGICTSQVRGRRARTVSHLTGEDVQLLEKGRWPEGPHAGRARQGPLPRRGLCLHSHSVRSAGWAFPLPWSPRPHAVVSPLCLGLSVPSASAARGRILQPTVITCSESFVIAQSLMRRGARPLSVAGGLPGSGTWPLPPLPPQCPHFSLSLSVRIPDESPVRNVKRHLFLVHAFFPLF